MEKKYNNNDQIFLMPAEWEEHSATWVAWPHLDSDFPGKVEAVRWAYVEFIRHLSKREKVKILCNSEEEKGDLLNRLSRVHSGDNYEIFVTPFNRSWVRDSAPTGVKSGNEKIWVKWNFNAWAKYEDVLEDIHLADKIAELSSTPLVTASRHDGSPFILEGGAIDVDGKGSLLVTEQCLLGDTQTRNPGLTKQGYEEIFKRYLGVTNTIWIKGGFEGDDTNGHIDDIARFAPGGVVLTARAHPADKDHYEVFNKNIEILSNSRDSSGNKFQVVLLPVPQPVYCDGVRLPASYLNFYIANGVVLVPTFNDPHDREALGILQEVFPNREVTGINCSDWILGYGSLHCSTQQELL